MSETKTRPTKAERNLRKYLTALVETVEQYVRAIDAEMRGPSTVERGSRIARLTNALEMQKDSAKHFGLGIDLRTGRRISRRQVKRRIHTGRSPDKEIR
jgi:hypothetical protein